jgi:hypothetical protein
LAAGELDEKRNGQKMPVPNANKLADLYSLDVIVAVGRRAKSPPSQEVSASRAVSLMGGGFAQVLGRELSAVSEKKNKNFIFGVDNDV